MKDSDKSIQRAAAAAMRLLAYRPRSEAELRTRLKTRFPPHVVEQVIRHLAAGALLDDATFARAWRDSRLASRPRSASAIRRELVSHGIDRDLAHQAVQDVDDQDAALRAGLNAARRLQHADFNTFRRKLWGYLKRRGFTDSVTRRTVSHLWSVRSQLPSSPLSGEDKTM